MQKIGKTYKIITIGCQMNESDSERLSSLLESNGYKKGELHKADLVILNTCGVRQAAEDRIYGLVPKIKKDNPEVKLVLTGCLSLREDVKEKLGDSVDIWLPATKMPQLLKLLDKPDQRMDIDPREYLSIVPKYSSRISAFVPIGNGCDNFCAYCVVPYARGREAYRDADEIKNEVSTLVTMGYREITLIAQNVNSYRSNDIDFSDLLKTVSEIKGDFWIRFATSHPKDMSDKLIEVIASNDKICEHIHLPVQAGNNEVLRLMNRKYTVEHYRGLIERIRRVMPNASISTDIIVGFPGESTEQFNSSKKLFEDMKYDMAYIAEYSSRPGTTAEKMTDDVTKEEKAQRGKELNAILRKTALDNNRLYLNKIITILVEGFDRKGFLIGKTRTAKKVRISNTKDEDLIGTFQTVKILKVKEFGMEGELIINSTP